MLSLPHRPIPRGRTRGPGFLHKAPQQSPCAVKTGDTVKSPNFERQSNLAVSAAVKNNNNKNSNAPTIDEVLSTVCSAIQPSQKTPQTQANNSSTFQMSTLRLREVN
jgi:hypothetical protein